jgi:hypothetical protein
MSIDERLPSPAVVRKKVFWTMVVIAVGLAVSIFARQMASDAPSGSEFQDFVAELRAAGEPTTPGEFFGPEPPADVNAAPEIAAALKWLDETVGRENTWAVTGPWDKRYADEGAPWFERASPDSIRELRAFLVRIRPFFDRVAAAAEKPRFRFPYTVDTQGMIDSEGVSSLQRVTLVLGARGAVDPDPAARVEACRTLIVLARRFEPAQSVGELLKAAMAGASLTALRHDVETGAVDPASARARLDPLLAPTWLDLHARYFAEELVQHVSEFSAILDGRNPPSSGKELAPSAAATLVGWCKAAHDAAKWPTTPYAAYLRRARATVESARRSHAQTEILLPKVADSLGQDEARCRLARVALAVAEHRAKHGDFPASLDDVKPMFPDGVPLDPYNDAPFVYERTSAGARIASAGRLPEDKPLDAAKLRERCLVWELKR